MLMPQALNCGQHMARCPEEVLSHSDTPAFAIMEVGLPSSQRVSTVPVMGTQIWLSWFSVSVPLRMSHSRHCWKVGVCGGNLFLKRPWASGVPPLQGTQENWLNGNWTSMKACPPLPLQRGDYMRKWLYSQWQEHNSAGLDVFVKYFEKQVHAFAWKMMNFCGTFWAVTDGLLLLFQASFFFQRRPSPACDLENHFSKEGWAAKVTTLWVWI